MKNYIRRQNSLEMQRPAKACSAVHGAKKKHFLVFSTSSNLNRLPCSSSSRTTKGRRSNLSIITPQLQICPSCSVHNCRSDKSGFGHICPSCSYLNYIIIEVVLSLKVVRLKFLGGQSVARHGWPRVLPDLSTSLQAS